MSAKIRRLKVVVALCCWVFPYYHCFGEFNEGMVIKELDYNQTAAGSSVANSNPYSFFASIRNDSGIPQQTGALALPPSSLYATNPITIVTSNQLLGAHYAYQVPFLSLIALNTNFPDGAYEFNITRTYSDGTSTGINPQVTFNATYPYPSVAPSLSNTTWSADGFLVVDPNNATFSWNQWQNPYSTNSTVEIELWSNGSAGGAAMGANGTSLSWGSPLSSNAFYQARLSFYNTPSSVTIVDTDDPAGPDLTFRAVYATVLHFSIITTGVTASCSYSVENYPPDWIFDEDGGIGLLEIDASNACCWTVTSPDYWIQVAPCCNLGQSSGCGSGEVAYAVQSVSSFDCGTLPRTGTVYVDGRTFTITQVQSQPCGVSISLTNQLVDPSGGSFLISVTDTSSCCWSVQNTNNWIYVSQSSGSYSTSIFCSVNPNFTGLIQTGVVVIGTQTLTVVQPSVMCSLPPLCGISVTPSHQTIGQSGGAFTISVTDTSSCCWSVQNSNTWISVSPSSGWTTEGLSCSVNPNFTGLARTGLLVIATQEIAIVQPTAAAPSDLVILQAWYGANGSSNNVLSIIQANIISNTVDMSINNGTMGGDPAPGYGKTLYVLYQNDAGLFQQDVGEGGTLLIPDYVAQIVPPPQFLLANISGGTFGMSFATISNVNYTVQANLDLATTNWFSLTNFTGNGLVAPMNLSISNGTRQEFFRVGQP